MTGQGVGGKDALANRRTGADGGGGQGNGCGHNSRDGVEGAGKQADAERHRSGQVVECVERTEDVEGLEAGEEEAPNGFGRLVSRHGRTLFFLFSYLFLGKDYIR